MNWDTSLEQAFPRPDQINARIINAYSINNWGNDRPCHTLKDLSKELELHPRGRQNIGSKALARIRQVLASLPATQPHPSDLRDYFAAAALQGLLPRFHENTPNFYPDLDMWAKKAYAVADSMLAARSRPTERGEG